ncbi:MAG: hypothetical protein VXW25_09515, partial [Pseudomonadota bacterium]|nr:hypothetical protein [Pseudomonadota bacterium]
SAGYSYATMVRASFETGDVISVISATFGEVVVVVGDVSVSETQQTRPPLPPQILQPPPLPPCRTVPAPLPAPLSLPRPPALPLLRRSPRPPLQPPPRP